MDTDKNMMLKTKKAKKIDMKRAKKWDYAEDIRFASYERKPLNGQNVYSAHAQGVDKITNNRRMIVAKDRKTIYIYSSKEERWIPYKASTRSYSGWIWCAKYNLYRSTVESVA